MGLDVIVDKEVSGSFRRVGSRLLPYGLLFAGLVSSVFGCDKAPHSDALFGKLANNSPPVLQPITGITMDEGQIVVVTPLATDPDGDVLTYSSSYSSLVWGVGSFTWQTDYSDAGFYPVTITVDDGNGGIDSQNVNITINNIAAALGWIGGGADGWQTGSGTSLGTDYQSLDSPSGVGVDASGNIYVADTLNNRVSKWDSFGNAVGWLGGATNGWQTGAAPAAADDYQSFDSPSDVFVDVSGNIYVADTLNNRVSKWDS
ncbi:Ig-like domain-containing protein, partial [Nanoarchaeota archaeon]